MMPLLNNENSAIQLIPDATHGYNFYVIHAPIYSLPKSSLITNFHFGMKNRHLRMGIYYKIMLHRDKFRHVTAAKLMLGTTEANEDNTDKMIYIKALHGLHLYELFECRYSGYNNSTCCH